MQLTLNVGTARFVADSAGNVFMVENGESSLMEGYRADAKGNITVEQGGTRVPVPKVKVSGTLMHTVRTDAHFFERIGSERLRYPPDVAKTLDEMRAKGERRLKTTDQSQVVRIVYTTLQRLRTDPAAFNGALTAWIPRVLFLLLPLFALLLAAFYRRRRRDYLFVDHLVFSLNFHTLGFVLLLIAAELTQLLPGKVVAVVVAATLGMYLLLAMKRFYAQNWFLTGAKCLGVGAIYTVFFLLPAFAGIMLASVLNG
jgi:hypothetical protein